MSPSAPQAEPMELVRGPGVVDLVRSLQDSSTAVTRSVGSALAQPKPDKLALEDPTVFPDRLG
jgi:hypothetical protein